MLSSQDNVFARNVDQDNSRRQIELPANHVLQARSALKKALVDLVQMVPFHWKAIVNVFCASVEGSR